MGKNTHSGISVTSTALKYFLSFVTFLSLMCLCVSVCTKSVITNTGFFEKSFISYNYTNTLWGDVFDYSCDLCEENNTDPSFLNSVLNFETVRKINNAYVSENLQTANVLVDETYKDLIKDLKSNVKTAVKSQNSKLYEKESDQRENIENNLAEKISSYVQSAVSKANVGKLNSITDVTNPALIGVIAFFAFLFASLATITFYTEKKRYRGLRYVYYSVSSATLMNFVLGFVSMALKKNANLNVNNKYLLCALESQIDYSIISLFVVTAALAAISVLMLSVIWKLKRKNK